MHSHLQPPPLGPGDNNANLSVHSHSHLASCFCRLLSLHYAARPPRDLCCPRVIPQERSNSPPTNVSSQTGNPIRHEPPSFRENTADRTTGSSAFRARIERSTEAGTAALIASRPGSPDASPGVKPPAFIRPRSHSLQLIYSVFTS